MSARLDLAGQTFGRFTVLREARRDKDQRGTLWRCRCQCGVVKIVRGSHLKTGNVISCGCYQKEGVAARSTTHGHARGGKLSMEYKVWRGMLARCHNSKNDNFHHYGGRGIAVCRRWRTSFTNFLVDMGSRPPGTSIERKNNDRGYSPRNCKWATPDEQARNKQNNRWITVFGERKLLTEWARDPRCKVSRKGVDNRLAAGWSAEEALSTPTNFGRPRILAQCDCGEGT